MGVQLSDGFALLPVYASALALVMLAVGTMGDSCVRKDTHDASIVFIDANRTSTWGDAAMRVADIDGDGSLDVVLADSAMQTLAWYRNNGTGGFASGKYVIDSSIAAVTSVAVADLDGDGRLDLATVTGLWNTVDWFRNMGGSGMLFTDGRRSIDSDVFNARAIVPADLDGDGSVDLVVTGEQIDWLVAYVNNGTGGFERRIVDDTARGAAEVAAGDLDGDGAVDLVLFAAYDNYLAIYRNNGSGWFPQPRVILVSSELGGVQIFTADLNADGSLDIVVSSISRSTVAWFENDGAGGFATDQPVTIGLVGGATQAAFGDIDNDGTLDVVVAGLYSEVTLLRNAGGRGLFPQAQQALEFVFDGTYGVAIGDMDRDGLADVVVASYDDVAALTWLRGHRSVTMETDPSFVSYQQHAPRAIALVDLTGDGLQDVLAVSEDDDGILYYTLNDDIELTSESKSVISTTIDGPYAALAADIDSDGWQDVVVAADTDLSISWLRNTGAGVFRDSARVFVAVGVARLNALVAADLDGDSVVDLLTATASTDTVAWYRNNGTGDFGSSALVLSASLDGATSVVAVDLNGDGWLDVLVAVFETDSVVWFASDGAGGFAAAPVAITTTADGASCVAAADVDADGALDVLVASSVDNTTAWYRSDGAAPMPSFTRRVISSDVGGVATIVGADLDADGAPEVLVASPVDDGLFAVYANDGTGAFAAAVLLIPGFRKQGANLIAVGDWNNDGLADLMLGAFSAHIFAVPSRGSMGFSGVLDASALAAANAQHALPRECGGVAGSIACVAARVTLAASPCAVSSVSLPPLVRGCLASPLPIRNSVATPVTLSGAGAAGAQATVIACTRAGSQALFSLPDNSALTMEHVTVTVAASAARTEPGPSMISVCSADGSASDHAVLVLRNVTVSGYSNVEPPAAVTRSLDRGYGVIAVHGASSVVIAGCNFTSNQCGSVGAVLTLFGLGASAQLVDSSFVHNTASGGPTSALGFGGGGAVALLGASQQLRVDDSLFDSNAAPFGSGGALFVLADGVRLVASRVTMRANTAGRSGGPDVGGGALAIAGAGVVASWTNSTFTANAASSGSGGAVLFVSDNGAAEFARVTFGSNAAAVAGGALAVRGAVAARVSLVSCTLSGSSASFGGSISAVSDEVRSSSALRAAAVWLMPPGGRQTGGSVTLDASSSIGDSKARYGGAFFACAAVVNASAARLTGAVRATGGGGVAFRCNEAPSGLALEASAWLALPTEVSSFQPPPSSSSPPPPPPPPYGPVISTPPLSMAWLVLPPATSQSGVAWGTGQLVLTDALGQRVIEADLVVRLAMVAPPPPVGGVTAVVGTTGLLLGDVEASYSLALMAPAARGWPDALATEPGLATAFLLSIDADGAASSTEGSPTRGLTVALRNCAPGWGRVSGDGSTEALVCAACAGGTFSSAERAARGEPCDVCPANTLQLASGGGESTANSTVAECVCRAGFYSESGAANVRCAACPTGAVCAGGSAAPVAAPGFFPEAGVFVSCPISGACLGNGACARGYTGRLCAQCAVGWYTLNGSCRACRNAQTAGIAVLLVVLALALTAVLLWFNAVSGAGGMAKFVAATIGLAALQVIALFGKLSIDWGPLASVFFQVASALSLNVQLASPECSLSEGVDSWTLKWALMLALPVFAALAVALLGALVIWPLKLAGVKPLGDLTPAALAGAAAQTWYQLLVLMQLPLTAAAMSPFGCRRDEAGRAILVDDPSRVCYDARWWRLFAPALIFSLLYGLALPASVALLLRRAHSRLDAMTFALRFGFLSGRFRSACYGAEALVMGGKVSLVLVNTVFRSDESKVVLGAFVLIAFAVLTANVMPYRRRLHNMVALWCLGSIVVVLASGALDATLLRRVIASIAIIALVLGVLVGNMVDLVILARCETGSRDWKGAAETADAFDAGDLGVLSVDDAGRGTMGRDVLLGVLAPTPRVHSPSVSESGLASALLAPSQHGFIEQPPPPPLIMSGASLNSSSMGSK